MSSSATLRARIPEALTGLRLDQALATVFDQHSRSRLQGWIREGRVRLDDRIVSQRHRIQGGEKVEIEVVYDTVQAAQAEAIDLDIIHEDTHIIVINKPAGLVVHPGAGNQQHTLMNALMHHTDELGKLPRAGIVHRLDKDTTGLMVIAKTPEAHTRLVAAIQARRVRRQYLALVRGELIGGGTIDQPVGRHPVKRTRMAIHHAGKPARTHYVIEERLRGFTLLRCSLETGRTHQIRVHMASLKHPVVGDPVYGGRAFVPPGYAESVRDSIRAFKRQALHACLLELAHPDSGELMSWQAPLPDDFSDLLGVIRDHG
jgi:23S rRNA pseudouridine1911/1915/1917 synthase